MVGSLVLVGDGKWSADDLARALAARDRARLRPGRAAAKGFIWCGWSIDCHRSERRDPGITGPMQALRAYAALAMPSYQIPLENAPVDRRQRHEIGERRRVRRSGASVWPTRPNSTTGQ